MAKIRTRTNWSRADADTVVKRVRSVVTGMGTGMGPTVYPTPPVSLDILKTAGDKLADLATEAQDGSRKVIADRDKQQELVVELLEQNAHYVESACKNDMATFLISGFEVKSNTKTPSQPLPPASIEEVRQGPPGVFEVTPKSLGQSVLHYEVQIGQLGPGGTPPSSWTVKPITRGQRRRFQITNLTAGVTYAVQVRALGPLGFTEWSDPINKMAT